MRAGPISLLAWPRRNCSRFGRAFSALLSVLVYARVRILERAIGMAQLAVAPRNSFQDRAPRFGTSCGQGDAPKGLARLGRVREEVRVVRVVKSYVPDIRAFFFPFSR